MSCNPEYNEGEAKQNKTEVAGAKRAENEVMLVRWSELSKKDGFFCKERCFFS